MKRWMLMAGVMAFAMTAVAEDQDAKKQERQARQEKIAARFKAADADGDQKLSATEFATFCTKGDAAKKFAAADTDKDSFLTREELKAAHMKRCQQGDEQKAGKKGRRGADQKPADA